jgi:hypothetical protein
MIDRKYGDRSQSASADARPADEYDQEYRCIDDDDGTLYNGFKGDLHRLAFIEFVEQLPNEKKSK